MTTATQHRIRPTVTLEVEPGAVVSLANALQGKITLEPSRSRRAVYVVAMDDERGDRLELALVADAGMDLTVEAEW